VKYIYGMLCFKFASLKTNPKCIELVWWLEQVVGIVNYCCEYSRLRCCMPYRISAVLPWNSTRLKTRCFPTTRSSVARQATPASTCKVRTCTLVLGPHGTPQLRREAQSVQGPQTAEKFSVENAQFLSKSSCSMIACSGSRERKILRGSSKLTKHVTGVDYSRNVITGVM